MRLSKRASSIAESATLAVTAQAAEMRQSGIDVLGYGAGEPDFDTPAHIVRAAHAAIDAGHTRYAKPAHGIPAAKAAVCEKFRRENGLSYEPDQVIVTVGGKEALYLACAAMLEPGDDVLLPVPYWVSFPEQIKLCGANPVLVRPDDPDELRLTPDRIAAALTPRTRAFIFNSPSNPGGFAYTPDEVRAFADALAGRDILVISDEIYDRLRFGDRREHLSFAATSPEWFEKTLTVGAASKTYAMTGWRVGFAAGPRELIRAMAKIQGHTTSGPTTFVQHALVEALSGDPSCVEAMRSEFEKRGLHMHARLAALRDVTCPRPMGAFYCFPNVSRTYARLGVKDSQAFCRKVLEDAHVALVPGDAFGSDQHVRLSFANSIDYIDQGMDRLVALLGRR